MRFIAIVCVIFYHVSGGIVDKTRAEIWITLDFYQTLTVFFSVPIFIMISGYLFLDPKKDVTIKKILFKYVARIVVAFCFWSVVYAWYNAGSWAEFWEGILSGADYHLWYPFMIIGLYLVTPILREAVKNKTLTEYILILCAVPVFVFPFLGVMSGVFNKIFVYLLIDYAYYFIAGHYFGTYGIKKSLRAAIYVFGCLSLVAVFVMTLIVSHEKGEFSGAFYSALYPFSAIIALALFLLFKSIKCRQMRGLRTIARCSFGIYLVHVLVIRLFLRVGVTVFFINPALGIPLFAVLVFIVSFAFTFLLSKIPVVRKWLI